jgi:hypothetical protein
MSGFIPLQGMSLGYNPFHYVGGKKRGGFHLTGSRNPSFYQNPGQFVNSSWKLSVSFNLGLSFQVANQLGFVNIVVSTLMSQPMIPFLENLHLKYFS